MAVFAGMEMYYVIGFTGVMIFIGLTLVVIGAIIFAYNDERKRWITRHNRFIQSKNIKNRLYEFYAFLEKQCTEFQHREPIIDKEDVYTSLEDLNFNYDPQSGVETFFGTVYCLGVDNNPIWLTRDFNGISEHWIINKLPSYYKTIRLWIYGVVVYYI